MNTSARWIFVFIIILALIASIIFSSNAANSASQWQRDFVAQLKRNETTISSLLDQTNTQSYPSSIDFEGIIRIEQYEDYDGIYFIYKKTFFNITGFLITRSPVAVVPIDAGITVEVIDKCDNFYIYRLTLYWD